MNKLLGEIAMLNGFRFSRRAGAALSAVLLATALVAGCGGSDDTGANPAPPPVVPTAPALSAQPSDAQVTAGGAARFSVSVASDGGTAVIAYQWQRSNDSGATWAAISGATTDSYTLAAPATTDNGSQFRAVVSRGSASTTSSAATLRVAAVISPAQITVQPVAQSVVASAAANFVVTATGTSLAYRWQSSSDGTTWADLSGASAATLQFATTTLAQTGQQVRVVVSNSVGSVTSSAVALTVTPAPAAPAFTLQPQAASVTAPASASFSASASGTPAPSYQWQRSSDAGATWAAIAGAAADTYTTAALSTSDSGSRFRVLATSSAGSATSDAVTLTVAAAAVAPSITTQPADVSVAAGQTATWSVLASAVPTPSFQWQLSTDGGATFNNINGATSTSYSVVATAADNGRRVRVMVSNSQGTVTSRAALLSVVVPVSGVLGRRWATALSLEENSTARSVTASDAAIDDSGRVTVVFRKSDGTRDVVYAMHGTPNAAGVAPTWTTPVAIDVLAGAAVSNMPGGIGVSVVAAPEGNAVAQWRHQAACTAATYSAGPLLCTYHYFARYSATTGRWSAPELLTDSPTASFQVLLNDRSDLVFYGDSWIPFQTLRSTAVKALFMRTSTETAFRRQLLSDVPTTAFQKVQLHMDEAGNLLMATEYRPANVSNIVAYRGSAAAGLTQEIALESPGTDSRLGLSQVGRSGQQVVIWTRGNDLAPVYAAASASAVAPFVVSVAVGGQLSSDSLSIADDGQAVLQALGSGGGRVRWTAVSGWLPRENAGAVFSFFSLRDAAISRSGDAIQIASDGNAAVFDQSSRTRSPGINSPNREYVLGFQAGVVQFGSTVLLSNSGVGFVLMQNSCAVLPMPPATQCTSQIANTLPVTSLWGAFRK